MNTIYFLWVNYTFREKKTFIENSLFMYQCLLCLVIGFLFLEVPAVGFDTLYHLRLLLSISHRRKGLHFDERKACIKTLYILCSIYTLSPKDT